MDMPYSTRYGPRESGEGWGTQIEITVLPLRAIVMVAQTQAGMWRRNGYNKYSTRYGPGGSGEEWGTQIVITILPLGAKVMVAQTQAGMWGRNGYALLNQVRSEGIGGGMGHSDWDYSITSDGSTNSGWDVEEKWICLTQPGMFKGNEIRGAGWGALSLRLQYYLCELRWW